MHTAFVAWQHTVTGLVLHVDSERVPVPSLIANLLLGPGGHGLTDDPAIDVLRLEQDLRRYARHVSGEATATAAEIADARDEVTLADAERGLAGLRHRRAALHQLTTLITTHTLWTNRRETARAWIDLLRQFVIDAAVPNGLLADAAAGWQRTPDTPPTVIVYPSEAAFLDADPRRAEAAPWGGPILSGVVFGEMWRRDGDDDDPHAAPLPRSGPWRVGWLPQTGEIYASRRCGYRPEQVWLLATGFHDRERTRSHLLALERHMRQPNSVILAATVLHDEQRRRESEFHGTSSGASRPACPRRHPQPTYEEETMAPRDDNPDTAASPSAEILIELIRQQVAWLQLGTGILRAAGANLSATPDAAGETATRHVRRLASFAITWGGVGGEALDALATTARQAADALAERRPHAPTAAGPDEPTGR